MSLIHVLGTFGRLLNVPRNVVRGTASRSLMPFSSRWDLGICASGIASLPTAMFTTLVSTTHRIKMKTKTVLGAIDLAFIVPVCSVPHFFNIDHQILSANQGGQTLNFDPHPAHLIF
jgi:hypothetical protein